MIKIVKKFKADIVSQCTVPVPTQYDVGDIMHNASIISQYEENDVALVNIETGIDEEIYKVPADSVEQLNEVQYTIQRGEDLDIVYDSCNVEDNELVDVEQIQSVLVLKPLNVKIITTRDLIDSMTYKPGDVLLDAYFSTGNDICLGERKYDVESQNDYSYIYDIPNDVAIEVDLEDIS
jgi:hypothetical protein